MNKIVSTLALGATLASAASAQISFSVIPAGFSDANVAAVATVAGLPGANPSQSIPFSTTTAFSFTASTNSIPTFYGGAYSSSINRTTSLTTISTNVLTYRHEGNTTDANVFRLNSVVGSDSNSGTEEVFWRAGIVFATDASGPYTFGASSQLTLTARTTSTNGSLSPLRFMVVSGGNTYVSQDTVNLTTTMASYNLSELSTKAFALWTPNTEMTLGALDFSVSGSSLDSVTHAGFYAAANRVNAAGISNVDFTAFSGTNFTAVPEPSSFAALAGFAALGFVASRRRRA